jgi:hypothetical protein
MKTSDQYCSVCGGQVFTRHKNPGNICDPCWLTIQQEDIEDQLWHLATQGTKHENHRPVI